MNKTLAVEYLKECLREHQKENQGMTLVSGDNGFTCGTEDNDRFEIDIVFCENEIEVHLDTNGSKGVTEVYSYRLVSHCANHVAGLVRTYRVLA